MRGRGQPWIHSAGVDGLFILGPAFFAVILVMGRPDWFAGSVGDVSLGAWLLLVVGIDVAHVYGTLYRTYFDPAEFRERRGLYTLAPLLGWLTGTVLYACGALVFWRVLAYLAVFHFIRQQYGFIRIYSRRDPVENLRFRWLDSAVIYLATLAPLVYWHTHLPRNFSWFVEGDFLDLGSGGRVAGFAGGAVFMVYGGLLALYSIKEIFLAFKTGRFNLPRNVLILGTALSWYVGIVRYNGDLAFTVTNVVAHGIPYMALVWIHGRLRTSSGLLTEGWLGRLDWFSLRALPLFVGALVLLAYLEEALWDALVWRDHAALFPGFSRLPQIADAATLAWLVPLLALPQITHYVLDGFIWRGNKELS